MSFTRDARHPQRLRRVPEPAEGKSMRRTALLVSAALLTGLLPLASAGAATGAEEPPPVPVDRFEGEVPFASQPAEGIFTWEATATTRPSWSSRRATTPPRATRSSPGRTTSAATAASPTTSPRTSPATTGPRTRASASGGTGRTPASGSTSRSRTAVRTARRPNCGRPRSPTSGPAGTRSRSPSATSPTAPTTSPSAASTRTSASPRCGVTRSPCPPARPAPSPWTEWSCTARPTPP